MLIMDAGEKTNKQKPSLFGKVVLEIVSYSTETELQVERSFLLDLLLHVFSIRMSLCGFIMFAN